MSNAAKTRRMKRGCAVAAAALAGGVLTCVVGAAFVTWRATQNPAVQAGVRAAGAAIEMNREAIVAPGAQALRDAGCRHAMVYSPALTARFVVQLELDGGVIVPPSRTLLVCASRRAPPSCAALTHAYIAEVGGDTSLLVATYDAEGGPPRCSGLFGPAGERERPPSAEEEAFFSVVRPQVL